MTKKGTLQIALPKKNRIKNRREFLLLKDRGKRFYSKNLIYLYRKSQNDTSRLGITVTTKIDKRAVVRNRIKRAVQEALRKLINAFKQPVDIVVIAKQGAAQLKPAEIKAEILLTLQRNGFIR